MSSRCHRCWSERWAVIRTSGPVPLSGEGPATRFGVTRVAAVLELGGGEESGLVALPAGRRVRAFDRRSQPVGGLPASRSFERRVHLRPLRPPAPGGRPRGRVVLTS